MAAAHIGTSGYHYEHWRGAFYPEDLPVRQWFEYYCQHFDAVEINNTFYHLPDGSTFDQWQQRAPDGFCYTLKFSRYGSHLKCLKEPGSTIGAFMDGAQRLASHLGPILVQLKPDWSRNTERLREFLEAAPPRQRWAVEFRNITWLCEEIFELLRQHNVALCIHDMLEDHPYEVTADWLYLRFHGDNYGGSYSPQFLTAQARKIKGHIEDDMDVYVFFNNDAEGFAVQNAMDLKRCLDTTEPT